MSNSKKAIIAALTTTVLMLIRWSRLWMIVVVGLFVTACMHYVTVPAQSQIPSPIIGHTVCIDPADPAGQAIIPCPEPNGRP
jgi:hypothetical protein